MITLLCILMSVNACAGQVDLPLIEYPVEGSTGDYFTIILSGDGGWHKGVQEFAEHFHQEGIPTLGWDARDYFSKEKTREEVILDLQEVISMYSSRWKKSQVVLIGYSFGADVLPYTINNLEQSFRKRIKHLVLLSPGEFASYKVTLASLFNMVYSGDPVLPQIKLIRDIPILLICNDDESICEQLPEKVFPRIIVKGVHRLDGKFTQIAQEIVLRL